MTKRVMEILERQTGLMRCKVCGDKCWVGQLPNSETQTTRYCRGFWQCQHGCKLENKILSEGESQC